MTTSPSGNDPDPVRGPLQGIRIIDWTVWQQGTVASMMLGDLGADVIKIEEREFGDGGRSIFAVGGMRTGSYFETNNRNKRSVAVDLKTPAGLDLVHRLVERSDIFMHNFRPGVPERLGLGYEALKEINPRLIYGEGSAFGSLGPDRSLPGHDGLGLARSGIMMACAEPDTGEPRGIAGAVGDQMGGTMLAFAILAALAARDRFGVGQKVESSLLGGMVWLQGINVAMQLMNGTSMHARRRSAGDALNNWYRCADATWIAIATPQSDRHWPELVCIFERPDLSQDPRFADHLARFEHHEELTAILDEIFATRTRQQWMDSLRNGTVPFAPVNDLPEMVRDQQVVANGYVQPFSHEGLGDIEMLGFPVRLTETPASVRRRAPELGEHTEEVLIEVLGLDWDEITRLKDEKVL